MAIVDRKEQTISIQIAILLPTVSTVGATPTIWAILTVGAPKKIKSTIVHTLSTPKTNEKNK